MSSRPVPTRTRVATVVVALAATAIGTVTPAASDARPADLPAGDQAAREASRPADRLPGPAS